MQRRAGTGASARLVAWCLVVLVLAACGGDGVPDLPAGIDPTAVPSVAGSFDPLGHLPPCSPTTRGSARDVDGLVLPEGAVLTTVRPSGPVTEVRGFVEQTPVQVRAFYEDQTGVDMLTLEDEGVEAEALYRRPDVRVYVKAKAICATGSSILAVVGRGDAATVPTPAGGLVNSEESTP